MLHIPSIRISIDKEADARRFQRFLNHPDYPGKRVAILQFFPKLNEILAKTSNKQEVVQDFVLDMYKRHGNAVKSIVKSVEEKLLKTEPVFFALAKYMNFPHIGEQAYSATPTFLPFSPLNNNAFFFSIASLQSDPMRVVFIATHEISHIIFYKQFNEWSKATEKTVNHPTTHYFKEALTTAIMDQPEFGAYFDYHKLYNNGHYIGNFELHQLSISSPKYGTENIASYFKREVIATEEMSYMERLHSTLNIFANNQPAFNEKWRLWNTHLSDKQNESILKEYSVPVVLK